MRSIGIEAPRPTERRQPRRPSCPATKRRMGPLEMASGFYTASCGAFFIFAIEAGLGSAKQVSKTRER